MTYHANTGGVGVQDKHGLVKTTFTVYYAVIELQH